jgi:hypothetical protein
LQERLWTEHHVRRLEVAVDDVSTMQIGHSLGDLQGDAKQRWGPAQQIFAGLVISFVSVSELAATLPLVIILEKLLERFRHQLHEQPVALEAVAHEPERRAHVRVAERQHQLRLAPQALLARLAPVHKFERGHRAKVTDGEDRAVRSSADLVEDLDLFPIDETWP